MLVTEKEKISKLNINANDLSIKSPRSAEILMKATLTIIVADLLIKDGG
jgi:hypothetical protein